MSSAPRRFSGFRLGAFDLAERTAALLGGRRLYHRWFLREPRLVVRHEVVVDPSLPPGLTPLRILHLSDLHGGPFVGEGALDHVERIAARLAPDLVCWTGDMVVHGADNLRPLLPALRRIEAPLGTYAVFGNHDYKRRREGEMAAWLPAWRFLRNGHVDLDARGVRLRIGGVEDLEEGRAVDFDLAAGDAREVDLLVGLSHSPLGAPDLAARGARVVLSGHSHGTQVDLPWLRTLGPAHPGLRVALGEATLIVSRGLGPIGIPLRVGAPAEVVLVEVRPSEPPEAVDSGACREVSGSTAASSTSDATP